MYYSRALVRLEVVMALAEIGRRSLDPGRAGMAATMPIGVSSTYILHSTI